MRIDSHVHVWTLGAPPYTHNDDMSTQRPEYPGLVENLIRYMDLNEIDRTVPIQLCITDTTIVIYAIVSSDFQTVYTG